MPFNHFPDTIDMAADQMAAQRGGGRQRPFQIHCCTDLKIAAGGAGERLRRDVRPEAVIGKPNRRETDTTDGDTVADFRRGEIELARGDAQTPVAALRLAGGDMAECLDDACEHESTLGLTVNV